MRAINYFFLSAALLFSTATSLSQRVPVTSVTTLTGQSVTFPKAGSEKPLLLLLSFSHKSGDDLTEWNKHFKTPYASDSRVDFYELYDFQGVPSFMMKMILHGMRRSVKEPEKSHAAPFYSDEDDWKKIVGFDQSNIIYVVLANAHGDILWQTHGPASEAKAAELEAAVLKAQSTPN